MAPADPRPIALHGQPLASLCRLAAERLPRGHGFAPLAYREAVREGRFDPSRWSHASQQSRDGWRTHFTFELPQVACVREEPGPHGLTAKAVLRLADGLESEIVWIPMGRRRALCISSQVGCKMGCTFCETARLGLLRHLSSAEIVSQLLTARHRLGWRVDQVVFQGMGEPLDNYEAVVQALRVFTDPAGLAMGQERFSLCTVGHVPGLRRLREEGFKRIDLSFSLHAAEQRLRERLVPSARKWPLEAIHRELRAYRPRANFALGIHYCLIPTVNDRHEDARAVARFCEGLGRVLVHLIPYNPGSRPVGPPPTAHELRRFVGWLREEGLPVRTRVPKGRSVMAACGQLGNLALRETFRRGRRTAHPTRHGGGGEFTSPRGF